jgi:hypothetical protein
MFRGDTRRSEKYKFAYPCSPCCVYYITFDEQIVANELGDVGAIGQDPANACGSQKNILGLFLGKKAIHCSLVAQVDLGTSA